uniref:VASt domain-containing protein n=1 Tax=Arcella intermedia TaxID=1963864 RepID=A0A6B2KZU8_9EUKA
MLKEQMKKFLGDDYKETDEDPGTTETTRLQRNYSEKRTLITSKSTPLKKPDELKLDVLPIVTEEQAKSVEMEDIKVRPVVPKEDVEVKEEGRKELIEGKRLASPREEIKEKIHLPPLSEKHSLFSDKINRVRIVERDLQTSLVEFWKFCWTGRSQLLDSFALKAEHSEVTYDEWVEPDSSPGCWQRNTSWIVQLRGFGVGPSKAQVVQTQRSRLVNPSHLIIDISSVTKGIPFGDDFTWEERWSIQEISENNIKIIMDGITHWINHPWGASMLKGTIDKKCIEVGKQKFDLLLDLAEQFFDEQKNTTIGPEAPEPEPEVERIIDITAKNLLTELEPEPKGKEILIESPAKVPIFNTPNSPPNNMEEEIVTFTGPRHESLLERISRRFGTNLSTINFYLICFLLVLLVCTIISFIFLSYKLSNVESHYRLMDSSHLLSEKAEEKLRFLEYFIYHLSRNITGNPDIYSENLSFWKSSHSLNEKLEQWKREIENMQELLGPFHDIVAPSDQYNLLFSFWIWFPLLIFILLLLSGKQQTLKTFIASRLR